MMKIYTILLSIFLLLGGVSAFGQNANYLDFDGSTDYVYYADDATLGLLDRATDYTIDVWIFPVDGRVAEFDRILTRYHSFKITMYDQLNNGNVEDWYFSVSDGSGNYTHYNTEGDATLTLDAWNHIAIINNSTDGSLKLFVNGIEVTQSGGYSNQSLRASVSSDNLYIGSSKGSTPNNSFGGYIDEVRLKNTAETIGNLSTSQYDNQYSTDANTAGLFHFNEGSGANTVNKASGSNATLYNVLFWRSWSYEVGNHLPLACEFTGATNADWATSGNWDGGIPTSTNDVIIPNTSPQTADIASSTNAVCNNITVENSSTIWLYTDGTLTASGDMNIPGFVGIFGDLTVNGDLSTTLNDDIRVYSDASNQGSIIHNTASVGATFERYITAFTNDFNGWHLLSSPVDNFAIASSHFEPSAGVEDLFTWDEDAEDAGMWINYHKEGGGFGFSNFTNGQGYLCAYNTSSDYEFSGNLNVSSITHNNMSADYGKWHLLGNPFASALDWANGDWAITAVSVPEVYDEANGDYFPVTDPGYAGIIPSTQGFFVEVSNATNSITIPTAARVHDNKQWYKNTKEYENTLCLKLSGGNDSFSSQTTIVFDPNSTEGYDIEFDSHKILGSSPAPKIFTIAGDQENFATNHIPPSSDEILIPTNTRVFYDGEYTIDVRLNTVVREGDIYLEDLETGVFTNLSTTNSYTFTASEDDAEERFMLHFNSATGINDLENNTNVNIYANDHMIYLNAEENIDGEIIVYDMGGKLILSEKIQNSNMHRISAQGLKGVYLVQLIEAGSISTQKVIIQ